MKRRPILATAALTATTVLAIAGCTAATTIDNDATKILQTVAIELGTDGAIRSVDSVAVSLNEESKTSSSSSAAYVPGAVAQDLPVRITTEYRTGAESGSDLGDLAGHTGRIAIDLTIENLTVKPQDIAYDAAGRSHVTPALVGAPLSIAGSVAMPHLTPDQVVINPAGVDGTNGVLSATEDGGTVIQWATLLAPPQTAATATFRLVIDAVDFTPAQFDISVQAGFHTDMTFEGSLASAFIASPTSELGIQQRAIRLVSDVNEVLNDAGATITEVRNNLKSTTDTLGVRAARELNNSTKTLTAQMRHVGNQLQSLRQDMDSTITTTGTSMKSQLAQLVRSTDAMLGDTTGTLPNLITGEGCAATVAEIGESGTVFSLFLQMAAQLDGYATVTADCRDEATTELERILGPLEPTTEACTETSVTCALFEARTTVASSLADLVAEGERIVADLDTTTIGHALDAQATLDSNLATIDQLVSRLKADTDDVTTWRHLQATLTSARQAANDLAALNATATTAINTLGGAGASVRQQQVNLADEICELAQGSIDREQFEALRAQLVDTRCDGSPQTYTPPQGSLDTRVGDQIAQWEVVQTATDAARAGTVLNTISTGLNGLLDDVDSTIATIEGGGSTTQQLVSDLQAAAAATRSEHLVLSGHLVTIQQSQATLATDLTDAITGAATDATRAVDAQIDEQTRTLTERMNQTRDDIIRTYNTTIHGLASSSEGVLESGREQVEAKKSALAAEHDKISAALDERTAEALERINASTAASARDVDAATLLLTDSLNKVLLDLGTSTEQGTGILGAMAGSAATATTADYQLALATQYAAGFANVRAEDIAGIMLRQAQFELSLDTADTLPPFHLDIPDGAASQTIYHFNVNGAAR